MGAGLRYRGGSVLDRDAALRTSRAAGLAADDSDFCDRRRRRSGAGRTCWNLSDDHRSRCLAGTITPVFPSRSGALPDQKRNSRTGPLCAARCVERSPLFPSRSHFLPEPAHLLETRGAAIRARYFPFRAALRWVALYRWFGKRGGSANTFLADRQIESPLCPPIRAAPRVDTADITIKRVPVCGTQNRSAAEAGIAGDAFDDDRPGC